MIKIFFVMVSVIAVCYAVVTGLEIIFDLTQPTTLPEQGGQFYGCVYGNTIFAVYSATSTECANAIDRYVKKEHDKHQRYCTYLKSKTNATMTYDQFQDCDF